MTYTATYSPDDNKLRLYASSRLPADVYERVKAAGFRWAPKQDLFVAPMWTPAREDLLLELAGEIGDEDKSLADRAEQRAERFEDYSAKRAEDAHRAHAAVAAIADHIPLGQPILVGHHSERHARKDAERIESGMRKAVNAWRTSSYWTERAAGALAHAQHKERADVRQRRIKGLEADLRKVQRSIADATKYCAAWAKVEGAADPHAAALAVANYDHVSRCFPLADYPRNPPASQYEGAMSLWSALEGGVIDWRQARDIATRAHERGNDHRARWLEHYENRLAYERAMLADQGGGAADRWQLAVGGRIKRRGEWLVIAKVNPSSVSVVGHWASTCPFDEIADYRAPTPEEAAAVAKAFKTPPLCNYPGEGFIHMTREELAARPERRWSDFPKTRVIKATETHGAHRVQACRGAGQWSTGHVYVTDAPRKDPPTKDGTPGPDLAPRRDHSPAARVAAVLDEADKLAAGNAATFERMAESLKAGVQVVSAPQLFPTPAALAARMVELAGIEEGHRILEPSAGAGNILRALPANTVRWAVEISPSLAGRLNAWAEVRCGDFLEFGADALGGLFDRVVMNPPFERGADIAHIRHAISLLKPGGRLVALCANGPRQNEALRPLVDSWEDLPADTFKAEGTGVRVALLVYEAPEAKPAARAPVEQIGLELRP